MMFDPSPPGTYLNYSTMCTRFTFLRRFTWQYLDTLCTLYTFPCYQNWFFCDIPPKLAFLRNYGRYTSAVFGQVLPILRRYSQQYLDEFAIFTLFWKGCIKSSKHVQILLKFQLFYRFQGKCNFFKAICCFGRYCIVILRYFQAIFRCYTVVLAFFSRYHSVFLRLFDFFVKMIV